MLTKVPCFTCRDSSTSSPIYVTSATTEYWTLATCPNGHTVLVIFQSSGWARLFDRALARLAVGMPRDAALDAYTAFEMYLAHVPVRARYDREMGASPRKLREEMKGAIGRAEAAIGAARCAASIVSNGPAIMWNEEVTVTVRNKAIHAGVYPTEKDAEKLCVEVARTILAFEDALDKAKCVNSAPYHMKVWLEGGEEGKAKHANVKQIGESGPEMFDWTHTKESRPTVAGTLAEYRKLLKPGDVL